MPRAARGRTTRSTRSPATFALDGHLIETYNHIDDLPQLSSLPKKRPRHATRGATAAERRADRQAAASTSEPIPNGGIVTRSSRQNLLRPSNSSSPLTAPSPSSEDPDYEHPPIFCRVCLKSNTPTKIICCSICRKGIHTFCLNPPVMDLPNDASWKCIKCRRSHIPFKKEARIILRDALNTYSTLCTHNYVNAVANVVCVMSDAESEHKSNPNTSTKPNRHIPLSPTHIPNDNTVILRVSTDDSDLDSDVDDDIQPNPIVNSEKIPLGRPPEHSDNNHNPIPPKLPVPRPQVSPPSSDEPAKEDPVPSSSSSLDIDDERPLSELMSRSAHMRHRFMKDTKLKDLNPAHASPKLRLKAKQRRMREENLDRLSPTPSDPKSPRDPRNLPPKRRGRKPCAKGIDSDACDNTNPMDTDCQNEGTAHNERNTEPVRKNGQDADSTITPTRESNHNEVKRESNGEVVALSNGNDNHTEKSGDKDIKQDMSDASASNMEEGYPGDTEDDLPLSKRSARYRKMSLPGSSKEGKDEDTVGQGGEHESRDNMLVNQTQVPKGGKHIQEPKLEAVVQETTGNEQPVQPLGPSFSADDGLNPSTSQQSLGSNSVPETNSSRKWPQMTSDPKHEALFALARVQRQRPKPGDSSGHLVASVEGEAPGRLSKLISRTNNVPESELQRIQVTALAASNMRRNVSNMASTMAGLRPHSSRVSKGSINLLLQQNQTDVRGGSVAPQRSYAELEEHEVSMAGLESHRDRDSLPQKSSRLHLSEENSGKFSPQMYPLSPNPRRQEGPGGSSVRQYGNPALGGGTGVYSMREDQGIPHRRMLSSLEPEAQPFGKHSHGAGLFRHAKKHRTSKSDLQNMLSNDNIMPMDDYRNTPGRNLMGKAFPDAGRQLLEQSTVRYSPMQGHSSSRPTQTGQAMSPYSYPHRLSESRLGLSGAPANVQGRSTTGSDRLPLPQALVTSIDDRNLQTRTSRDYGLPSFPYKSSLTPGGTGGHRPREEDNAHVDQRPLGGNSMRQGQGSDFRSASQARPLGKPAGEPFSPGLRWNEERNLGTSALRGDYAGANTGNQPWSDLRLNHRSALQEGAYDSTLNQFMPIDRRTRRPMPYVPTATRKAQFEQGRAMAIIDSRPAPPSAEPSDAYRQEEGASRMTPSPYSVRQESPYVSSHNDCPYPAVGSSRTAFPSMESQAPTSSFRDGYYSHRRGYLGASSEHHVGDRGPFLSDSRRDTVQRERVGGEIAPTVGSIFGQPRSTVHRPSQHSSGAPLEPPIGTHKGLSIEGMERPALGPLLGSRVRSNQEKDLPRMVNALESDRRLSEKPTRLPTGPGQDDRGYSTDRMGDSSHRSQEFVEPSYGSYLSGKNQNEVIRAPVGIMDSRIPTPLHADPGQYRTRDTLSGQAGRSFAPNIIGAADRRGIFDRPSNQISNSYSYTRRDTEARGLVAPQRVPLLEERNEELRADRVANIPLVARFDNSLTGYADSSVTPRANDGGSKAGDRLISQRNEQREQLPSIRSNPSLRDLLS